MCSGKSIMNPTGSGDIDLRFGLEGQPGKGQMIPKQCYPQVLFRVVRCSQAEDESQAGFHLAESPRWQQPDTLGEEGFVDGDELRHVHHRIPGEPDLTCLTQHIAWGSCQP